jgi:putative ATPase
MNQVCKETVLPAGQRIQIVQGDITAEPVEAIVNAANRQLQHGGGVAGVIARKGGPQIQAESDAWVRAHGPVSPAEPAYTGAGSLHFRYILHAVGPVWGEGHEDQKLAAAVSGSLRLAARLDVASLSLPAISTGIFGFPKLRAAQVIFRAIQETLDKDPGSSLKQVRLVLYDQASLDAFLQAWEQQGFSHPGEQG